jgi:hypothetical protein
MLGRAPTYCHALTGGDAPHRHTYYLPGEGRGPSCKVSVTTHTAQLAAFSNWAPAFAGVVRSLSQQTKFPAAEDGKIAHGSNRTQPNL